MSKVGGLVSFLVASFWLYRWEAIRAFLYDQGFHLMASDSDLLWQWGMPLVFAAIGFYLFWRTGGFELEGLNWPILHVPFDDAARRVYEAAEKADVVEVIASPTSRAEDKLNNFKMLLLVDERVRLFGAKPPSTQSRLIPKEDLRRELYPSQKTPNALDHLIPADHPPAFVNVTVPRTDLHRIIKIYLTEYVAEAKQMRRGQWPR